MWCPRTVVWLVRNVEWAWLTQNRCHNLRFCSWTRRRGQMNTWEWVVSYLKERVLSLCTEINCWKCWRQICNGQMVCAYVTCEKALWGNSTSSALPNCKVWNVLVWSNLALVLATLRKISLFLQNVTSLKVRLSKKLNVKLQAPMFCRLKWQKNTYGAKFSQNVQHSPVGMSE